MKIVIDIDDNLYTRLFDNDVVTNYVDATDMARAIRKGTPFPKGHWIKTPKAVMGEGYMWYCNKCEYEVYQDSSKNYPSERYCPNCGAKMEE